MRKILILGQISSEKLLFFEGFLIAIWKTRWTGYFKIKTQNPLFQNPTQFWNTGFEITTIFFISRGVCKKEEVKIDIFGSSGDDMDIIVQEQILDFNVEEEDWLLFSNMGAFSYVLDSDMASVALPSKYGKFRYL